MNENEINKYSTILHRKAHAENYVKTGGEQPVDSEVRSESYDSVGQFVLNPPVKNT
jgi:hypothetical protein